MVQIKILTNNSKRNAVIKIGRDIDYNMEFSNSCKSGRVVPNKDSISK